MKFVLIVGPQAVGKMTVGQELAKLTNLKLLHNHATIDLLEPLFGFSPEMWQLSTLFRQEIFKTMAKSDSPGMIFTFVWAFNRREDWEEVETMCNIFSSQGGEIYLVELEANVEERLKRNNTPNRLENKPTKRNVDQSEKELLRTVDTERLNSVEGEITENNYLRINNTHLSAAATAKRITDAFAL